MGKLLAILRLLVILVLGSIYLLIVPVVRFLGRDRLRQSIWLRDVFLKMGNPLLGFRIQIEGNVSTQPAIYVGNHRSFIDPLFIIHYFLATIIVKADVKAWPFLGMLLAAGGVTYVKREDKNSRRAVRTAMKIMIDRGISVLVYPEGTTSTAPQTLTFHPGSFLIAAEHGIPVVPIALEYERSEVAWTGDATFLPHFFKIFSWWNIKGTVRISEPMTSDNWEDLRNDAQNWMDEQLLDLRQIYGYEGGA